MIMDIAMEELTGPGDHAMIVKGRRTKRARPSSSSNDDGGGGGGGGGEAGGEINSLCSDEISTSTEEDEDMANCLILLAQSGNCSSSSRQELQEGQAKNNNNIEKINSRKFTEVSTTTMAKGGVYVYECKTCDRSFPSFQALGGHRASHKKPKQTGNEEQQQHSPSVQTSVIANNKSISSSINKKIHECSICGLEFSSGQALGGHMRRHRIAAATTTTTITTSNDTITTESSNDGERPRNVLQLDLNLPAPEDDVHHDSKFQFSASQQSLFSSPALVDCHY